MDAFLQLGGHLRRSASGVFGFILESVPYSGVVAGGDDNCPCCFLSHDGVADYRGWCCLGIKVCLDPVSGDYFSYSSGEILRGKPGVVANQ